MTLAGGARLPQRIQRKRTKGWTMPENTVYVGRPTKWGNPYLLRDRRFLHADGTPAPFNDAEAREMVVRDFWMAAHLERLDVSTADIVRELRGKNLACWCPLDKPCHADVLLEIANG